MNKILKRLRSSWGRGARQPGEARRSYILLGLVVAVVILGLDWTLIQDSLAKFMGSSPGPFPYIFSAVTAGAPALAAISARRSRVGLAVIGGRALRQGLIAIWMLVILLVTAIRIVSATLPVAGTTDNLKVPGQVAPAPISNLQLFLSTFDPLSPNVVLAVAMAFALLFTGIVGAWTAWFSHNPLAALRSQASAAEMNAQTESARAQAAETEATARHADAKSDAPTTRDSERYAAAESAIDPLIDLVLARMNLELAAKLGDPDATTRIAASVRHQRSRPATAAGAEGAAS